MISSTILIWFGGMFKEDVRTIYKADLRLKLPKVCYWMTYRQFEICSRSSTNTEKSLSQRRTYGAWQFKKMNRGTVYLPTSVLEVESIVEETPLKVKKVSKELKEFLKEAKSIDVPAETNSQLKNFRENLKVFLSTKDLWNAYLNFTNNILVSIIMYSTHLHFSITYRPHTQNASKPSGLLN